MRLTSRISPFEPSMTLSTNNSTSRWLIEIILAIKRKHFTPKKPGWSKVPDFEALPITSSTNADNALSWKL